MIKYFAKEIATGKLIEARGQDYLFDGYFYDTMLCWYVGSEDGPYFNVLYTDFFDYFDVIEQAVVGYNDL
jgi:hypothetical protein